MKVAMWELGGMHPQRSLNTLIEQPNRAKRSIMGVNGMDLRMEKNCVHIQY